MDLPCTDELTLPWETMAWSVPRFSRKQVNEAGELLVRPPGMFERLDMAAAYGEAGHAVHVVNNWRASHNWPLYAIRKTLENRAKRIAPSSLIAQRIKRLPSIEAKLRNFRHLTLTQIQDIGGCRAILPTVDEALALVETYKVGGIMAQLSKINDYIAQPKSDGYRSIHLIYKYRSSSLRHSIFNNHKIEIQIRSQLQHAWATAVETVSIFADLPIRATSGSMKLRPVKYIVSWRRLFALMATAIAIRESSPIVPGTPTNASELVAELRALDADLHVKESLHAWSLVLPRVVSRKGDPDEHWFLMRLDPEKMRLEIETFKKEQSMYAFNEYVTAEQPERDAPSTQVVLVSVDSLDMLQRAYPNYYADTRAFVKEFEAAIK